MYVALLMTSPETPTLDPALVESLRNAWGGGDAIWPAPDEVAEFALRQRPENFEDVWQSCHGMGVDLVVIPAEGRRKRMLLADMDSTMIRQECIDELADAAGAGDRVREITARAMNGEIGFEGALRARVGLLRGLPEGIVDTVFAERITLMPGAQVLLSTMKADGAFAALVSGGFTAFTGKVSAILGFNEHRANTLLAEAGKLTGEVEEPILGREAKVAALGEFTEALGISEADVIAVGDGANDLGMLGRAGLGVALHAKPAVAAQCDIRINHGDLTALLYLQGYAKADFVTT